MKPRIITLPKKYESRIEQILNPLGYSLNEPRPLAEAIRRLSDYYTQVPDGATPWAERWAQAASLAYYFPLNYARNRAAFDEAQATGFFNGLNDLVDFGSGMGSALLALQDSLHDLSTETSQWKYQAYDTSDQALRFGLSLVDSAHTSHHISSPDLNEAPRTLSPKGENLLILASYVLTELAHPPSWWSRAEGLILIEPSTQSDARRLMQYRETLIEAGYSIWGPCTHQGPCPLLHLSKTDWCHDRIHFEAPLWMVEIEKYLPMKNRTLTFSYLLARKTKRAPAEISNYGRLVGDMLEEKGKTRQALCRGPEREFLSWFPQRLKKGESIELYRGHLIELSSGLEKKATEVRIKSPQDIQDVHARSKKVTETP